MVFLLYHAVGIRQCDDILLRASSFTFFDDVGQRIGKVDVLTAAFSFAVVMGVVMTDQTVMRLWFLETLGVVIIQSFQLIR